MRPIPTEPMLENCAVCQRETVHKPDRVGTYHCTDCWARAEEKRSGYSPLAIVLLCLALVAIIAIGLVLAHYRGGL